MSTRTYKDNFTLDGRVKVNLGVTPKKVKAVNELLEAHLRGDYVASGKLREALTTSDAIFNFAHLATLNFVPNYDKEERQWQSIAGERTVPDLKPVTLYSLNRGWTDGNGESNVLGSNPAVSPIIPEGTIYPYAYISGEVAEGASVVKRGFKTDWTLESRINDGLGALDILPDEMLTVALDTEEADVFGALIRDGKGVNSVLVGGTVPNGETVAPNAAISVDAISRAVIELANREINGRKIKVNGGYNLIVPTGQKMFVQFMLDLHLNKVHRGDLEFTYHGSEIFSDLTIVESDFLSGTEWFLLPKKGATRRPVLEHLSLRGYETPQLFVDNHVGSYVGGGAVSPFEGSFDADVITLKLRQFGGGVLWDNGLSVVYSNGTGVA